MKFNFKAKTKTGEYKEGVINATSKDLAVAILQKNNLLPINLKEEKKENDLTRIFLKYFDRVVAKELVVFFRQMAILIEARVPIIVSLTAIKEQTTNAYFERVIMEMINNIEDGMPFSSAMEKHKDVFSILSINIIKAGETSGNLKKSITYVAENIERNYVLASRVRSALLYPAMILVVFAVIGFLVVTFIIPKLSQIIIDMNATIPWYTQVVIGVGAFMSKYWWAVLVAVGSFIGTFMYYLNTNDGKKEWDQLKIKLPIIGPIFRFVYITRFSENLGVLLTGGIPIIRALTVVSTVINNVVFEEIFLQAAEEVKKGGNMSAVLRKNPIIPSMVTHMISIGEESGQIDAVLGHVARFYDQETETMTKNLSTLLEPVLMIIIGVAVGFLAFAILMPIYNIAGQIQ
jgi:type IV pilus assembly protein PilC